MGEATGLALARGLSFCGPWPPHFRPGKPACRAGIRLLAARDVYVCSILAGPVLAGSGATVLPFLGGASFGDGGVRMVDGYDPFPFVAEGACQALGEQYVVVVQGVACLAPGFP